MALGAYADPERGARLRERLARLYTVAAGGERFRFALDLRYFDHYQFDRAHDFGPLADALGVAPRTADEPLGDEHYAVAWALGRCFEEILRETLRHARAITGEDHVALAGGCFMNSVANGKLLDGGAPFSDVHVPPYPDDSGTAVGAALHATLGGRGRPHRPYRHNAFGPRIDPERAARALRYRKVPFARVADPAEAIAAAVAGGEVVAIAAGRMEFGPRALGQRSILADPRDPDVRRRLNEHVKNRQWFRPYGVSVLTEHAAAVFDCEAPFRADFMERVRPVRPEWADRIRGVTHADGSVRVHTVDDESAPGFAAVLRAFHRRTGVPLVVNTSFNVAGMPIVRGETDAIDCFFACGIDTLFLENVVVRKAAAATGVAPATDPAAEPAAVRARA